MPPPPLPPAAVRGQGRSEFEIGRAVTLVFGPSVSSVTQGAKCFCTRVYVVPGEAQQKQKNETTHPKKGHTVLKSNQNYTSGVALLL